MQEDTKLKDYIEGLTPLSHPILLKMEQVAHTENVPIIERPAVQLIRSYILSMQKVERILEIGTAIGYSTIWLAQAAPNAKVDSIERDTQKVEQARSYIKEAALEERITVHHADAKDTITSLHDSYDVIFIDAAKGQYRYFFETYAKRLSQRGVIITDNILFHGHVLQAQIEHKRLRPMVQKLKAYNEWLSQHETFETSFVPIGDGLAFSIFRR